MNTGNGFLELIKLTPKSSHMGAPKKQDNKNIPKSREEDEDEDSLEPLTKGKEVDEDEDFDGPLDDLPFEDYGDEDDDDF